MANSERGFDRRKHSPWLAGFYWLIIAITFVPIVVMILYSFNATPTSRITFTWYGFTTYWYRNLTQVDGLTHAFVTSIEVAVISALISVAIGTPLSMALARYRFWLKGIISSMVFADIAAPSIVVGAASLSFFLSINLNTGLLTILIAHIAFNVAYVVVVVQSSIVGHGYLDRRRSARLRGGAVHHLYSRDAASAVAGVVGGGSDGLCHVD